MIGMPAVAAFYAVNIGHDRHQRWYVAEIFERSQLPNQPILTYSPTQDTTTAHTTNTPNQPRPLQRPSRILLRTRRLAPRLQPILLGESRRLRYASRPRRPLVIPLLYPLALLCGFGLPTLIAHLA